MKITNTQLKELVKTVVSEETEYQTFFKKALEKTGKSIPSMSDKEKKEFFNKIDAAWKAKGEKNEELTGNQHKLDVDGDGEIEASDLAALRAGTKRDESINEGKNSASWTSPKTGKSYDIQKNGNRWEMDIMKKGSSIYDKVTTIKRKTPQELKDWLDGYKIDSKWMEHLLKSVNENKINIDKKVTNIINTSDFKKFVRYINSFYGKKGVYSSGKDVKEKDIMKALYNVFKRNNSYEWGDGDSVDREFVRDELMKMGILSDKMYEQEVNEGLSLDIAKHMSGIHKGFVKVEGDGTMVYDSPATAKKAAAYLNSKKIAASSDGKYLYIESVNEAKITVTSIDKIPNIQNLVNQKKVTYRGLGMGKLYRDFYDIAGESGTEIKVNGKKYYITHTDFQKLGGTKKIKFAAPFRRESVNETQSSMFDSITVSRNASNSDVYKEFLRNYARNIRGLSDNKVRKMSLNDLDHKFGSEVISKYNLKGRRFDIRVRELMNKGLIKVEESVNEGSMDWEKHFKGYNEKELKVISKLIWMNPQGIDGVIKMSNKKDFKPFIQKAAKKGLGESVNEGQFKKFDDVHIKSKNLSGMVYKISGNTVVVRTIDGLVKVKKDDVTKIHNDNVNEDLGTIALGVMGGIGLFKILKFALKKVGVAVGSRVSLPKESLHKVVEQTQQALIKNFIKGDKTLNMMEIATLSKLLKDYIDDGTIKNAKDIQNYSKRTIEAIIKKRK